MRIDLVDIHLAAEDDQRRDLVECRPPRLRVKRIEADHLPAIDRQRAWCNPEIVSPVVANAEDRLHDTDIISAGVRYRRESAMKLGISISNFTWDAGPARLGKTLAEIAKTADQA